ncbi:TPA: ABC transporter permease [bacterium]|nr:ABC transporter permease [bacterium]
MAYVWHETFSNIRHSGVIGWLSITIVALTMMVFSLLFIVTNYLNTQLDTLKKSPFIVAFLKDDVADARRKEIQNKIGALSQVSSVRYVSKEEALRKTREMFGEKRDILDGLDKSNPLPSSFEIEVTDDALNKVKELAEKISKFDGIEDVQHSGEASKFIKSAEMIILIIFTIMSLSSIVIIFFSIAITTYVRREEIKIMRLVGATNAFIRIPLLLQGILEGFVGSVLGVSVLYGLFNVYGFFNLLVLDINIERFLSLEQVGMVIGTGAFIGLIGGAVPLRRFIRA